MPTAPWKEQATTIPIEESGLVLEGAWQRGDAGAAVVAPPHPEYGGSLDNPVVNELAYGLHQADFASIRFNWRGVGASQGRISGDPACGEADYRAAVDHMEQTCDLSIVGAGYSFGAAVAVRVALRDPRLRSLVLVAPPASMVESLPIAELGRPVCVIVGGNDPFAPVEVLLECFDVPHARVEVIPGADHFFASKGLAEVRERARATALGRS